MLRTCYSIVHLKSNLREQRQEKPRQIKAKIMAQLMPQISEMECLNIPSLYPPRQQSLAFEDDFSSQWTKTCFPVPVVWSLSQQKKYSVLTRWTVQIFTVRCPENSSPGKKKKLPSSERRQPSCPEIASP